MDQNIDFPALREGVRAMCAEYPEDYWRKGVGFGFGCEYDIERNFRERRLCQETTISTNLILSCVGAHVLGMPRSF